jgi:hypothetical protein
MNARPDAPQTTNTGTDPANRPSRVRRAIAASGLVGAMGLGSLAVAPIANSAPLSTPTVTVGEGAFDVVSGGY